MNKVDFSIQSEMDSLNSDHTTLAGGESNLRMNITTKLGRLVKISGGNNHKEFSALCKRLGFICEFRIVPRMERGYEKGFGRRKVVRVRGTQEVNLRQLKQ